MGHAIKSHNTLHKELEVMSQAAKTAGIQPTIKHHDVTSGVVAVAMRQLSVDKDSTTVIDGSSILIDFRNHHLGGKKARAFLRLHPPENRSRIIPAICWCRHSDAKEASQGVD